MAHIKITGAEGGANTTNQSTYANSRCVRVINTGTVMQLLSYVDVHSVVSVAVNTDVNATTLFVLSSGTTANLRVNDTLYFSSNLQVVNTSTLVKINSVTNSSAFVVNTDIIIANGTADVSISTPGVSTMTLLGNSETIVTKSKNGLLFSNATTQTVVMITPVSYLGS